MIERKSFLMPNENEIVNVRSSEEASDFWINAAKHNKLSSSFRLIKDDRLICTYEKVDKVEKLNLPFQKQVKPIILHECENYGGLKNELLLSRNVEKKVFRDVLSQCDNEKENMFGIIETQKKQIELMKIYQAKLLKVNGALTNYICKTNL